MLGRAVQAGILDVQKIDIRSFCDNKFGRVDDRPYGGGPGMVLMAAPVAAAIRSVKRASSRVIYLSPQGVPFSAKIAERLAALSHLVLLVGHYEGVDQRVIDSEVDEELSVGDFVLTNGCPAALIILDAMSRFIPGVLGDESSAFQDTFHVDGFDWEPYTRPAEWEGLRVPEILLSGDHAKIQQWRQMQAKEKSIRVRPDLYGKEI